jgi:type II secretory pathway predicted ATPase ExeA
MITTSIWPGNAKEKRGDLDGAIADYNQAIKLNPNYCIAYNNRGILRQMKGDLSGAMADFTLAQIIRSSSGGPMDLIKKRQKPIALFIDDAHDLHSKTLIGLKRLIEVVRDSGGMLSVVLAGHPKLKNDVRGCSMEEIGSRATIFELEGLGSEKRKYLKWLLIQSVAPKTKIESVITDDAVAASNLAHPSLFPPDSR